MTEQNAARKQALRSEILGKWTQDLKRGFGTINLYETKFNASLRSTQYQWKVTDIICWTWVWHNMPRFDTTCLNLSRSAFPLKILKYQVFHFWGGREILLFKFHTRVENSIFLKKKCKYRDIKKNKKKKRRKKIAPWFFPSAKQHFGFGWKQIHYPENLVWSWDLLQHHLKLYFHGIRWCQSNW